MPLAMGGRGGRRWVQGCLHEAVGSVMVWVRGIIGAAAITGKHPQFPQASCYCRNMHTSSIMAAATPSADWRYCAEELCDKYPNAHTLAANVQRHSSWEKNKSIEQEEEKRCSPVKPSPLR